MTDAPVQRCRAETASAVTELCTVCGGPFSQNRVIIDGKLYHQRCSFMSYPSHTQDDYQKLSETACALQARVEELTKALEEITAAFEGLRPLPLILDAMAGGLIANAHRALAPSLEDRK